MAELYADIDFFFIFTYISVCKKWHSGPLDGPYRRRRYPYKQPNSGTVVSKSTTWTLLFRLPAIIIMNLLPPLSTHTWVVTGMFIFICKALKIKSVTTLLANPYMSLMSILHHIHIKTYFYMFCSIFNGINKKIYYAVNPFSTIFFYIKLKDRR